MRFPATVLMILSAAVSAAEPEDLAAAGRFAEAAAMFLERAEKGPRESVVPSLLNAATCMKMTGDVSAAALHLRAAREMMGDSPSPAALMEWLALKGSIQALSKRPAEALEPLREALEMVDTHGDPAMRSDIENDLGIALSSAGRHAEAIRHFESSHKLACDDAMRLRSRQNLLVADFQVWSGLAGQLDRAREVGAWTGEIESALAKARARLDAGIAAAFNLTVSTRADDPLALQLRLTAAMAADRSGSAGVANRLYGGALEDARAAGVTALENSALLGLAEQYCGARRFDEALRLLDEVRRQSGACVAPDLARMEVLTAACRHGVAPGERATGDAIRRAIAAVEGIRSDLARSQHVSDLGRGFRDFAGRPYLLLADHLLRESSGSDDSARLLEARDAIERFKTWELNDFYRDDCVNLALGSASDLGQLGDPSVAVIHVIPLDDRTELLVGHDSGLRRFRSPIAGPQLLAVARRFRHRLESDYGTYRFMDDAELLHRMIVSPALGHLRSLGVKHLVFVPDGALGNLPPGAFLDGATGKYLLEEFSVSIAPNLTLLAAAQASGESRPLLACGMSMAVDGFAALPAVDVELDGIAALYPERVVLRNHDFTTVAMREKLLVTPTDVVHIATHGEFRGRAEESYLLACDGRITLDQLEEMIRPKKFVGVPVGLLCLSACRTAAGDDRAALGLAGAAVKSGARGVLATLWYVDDRATAGVMAAFHRRLRSHPGQDKAEALRRAQLELLRSGPDVHPSLWAPFILVGSWK